MIMDRIRHWERYAGLDPKLARALRYLSEQPLASMDAGKHEIDEDMFVLIQRYDTRPSEACFWEAHRTYTDIQYMFSGSEHMGVAQVDDLQLVEDHLDEKDYAVYQGKGNRVAVQEGEFVVFFTHDAHMPCMAGDEPKSVCKAVVKVRL